MPQPHQLKTSGFLFAFFGALLFSTKAILVKLAFAGTQVDALSLLTVRMLFALPFYVGAALWIDRDKSNVRMTGKQWSMVVLLGVFGYYLSSLFDFMGLQYISAGLERLILFLYPTFALLINAYVFKQTLSQKQWLAVGLTYAGIAVAYFGELQLYQNTPDFVLGSLLVLLCAVTYSIYIAGSGRIIPVVGANKFNSYAMLAATAGIFGHFLIQGNYEVFASAQTIWTYGPALAILSTVIPSYLLAAGMKRIGSSNVAIISSIGPVSTIVQAYFFLGEPIFMAQIVGTALVLAGIILLGVKK